MKILKFYDATSSDELVFPEVHDPDVLNRSALEVFSDFAVYEPRVIELNASAVEAARLLRQMHSGFNIVVDEDNHFVGLIDKLRLSEQKIVTRLSEGYKREELKVRDFMLHKNLLKTFDYQELSGASIQDVVRALNHSGLEYCLVTDREQHRVRGVIAARDIAERLHLELDTREAPSFVSAFEAIRNHSMTA
jgi:predicted transcriptional regulator